ncbi:zinc-ribbon domain-containing protein [Niallia taxi]|uniref:zinc ribbon domain-containing protein n=1 Tax=Niallia taxi TaxID=2499688 RepID=UPI0020413645|nr:zinc ribbon domain-containing protein [Niallia taxi]MCM3216089.1 zinc-ribbon domain-containing protein [Niallia taxi]
MKFCPECGIKIVQNQKYCHECGNNLSLLHPKKINEIQNKKWFLKTINKINSPSKVSLIGYLTLTQIDNKDICVEKEIENEILLLESSYGEERYSAHLPFICEVKGWTLLPNGKVSGFDYLYNQDVKVKSSKNELIEKAEFLVDISTPRGILKKVLKSMKDPQ